ncbi:MAG TPA: hypothetical protein VER79_10830 [Candidatus Limnocylindrales bacterium]|nr:hypothetical protein [Candidatus Limnocylindrales bacterium]
MPLGLILAFLVIYALASYMYGTARYRGEWNENDTWLLNRAITIAQDSDTVLRAPWTYANGLSYQAVGMFIGDLSGLSAADVQLYAMPILAAMIPLVAFAAYRALTGSTPIALLAVLFLLLQPDFMFVTWRGSHEKLTWLLTLALIFLLARSFTTGMQGRSIVPYMIAFYFIAFSLISVNAFFASSLIAALAFSFVLGLIWVVIRRPREAQDLIRGQLTRLILVAIVCFLFLYLFFFYVFPPARQLLLAARGLVESLNALLFARDPAAHTADAYAYVDLAYVAPYMYVVLSSFSFSLLGFSAIVWLLGARRLLFRTIALDALPRLFLWLMYVAFSVQLALSLVADRSGAVGSNLQVRLFTPFMIVVIPVAAIGIHSGIGLLRRHRRALAVSATAGALALSVFGLFALAKFTNEPLVNNSWVFSTQAEQTAGEWTVNHSYRPLIWEGWTARTRFPVAQMMDGIEPGIFTSGITTPPDVQYYVWSQIESSRWARANLTQPPLGAANLIYDNGEVQVYHRLPETPFQR